MESLEIKHKNFSIVFNSHTEEFEVFGKETSDEVLHSCGSLKEAKAFVDRYKTKQFKRFEAYTRSGYWNDKEDFEKVTVTSINQGYCWIVSSGGSREKKSIDNVYYATDSNKSLFKDIRFLENQESALEKQKEKLEKKLVCIKDPLAKKE